MNLGGADEIKHGFCFPTDIESSELRNSSLSFPVDIR